MRLSPAMVAAATCLTLLASDAHAATVAPPGGIEISRRVDPSLDPFMRTEQRQTPAAAMTFNQQWLSTHARPLVVHDSDPAVSLNLTGWATKPKVAVYYNATGVNPYRTTQMRQAKKWLMSQGGKPVMVDGWRALDLRIPAARKWWLYGSDGKATCNEDRDQRSALDLLACGYSGLWLDNALTTPKQGFSPTPKIPVKAWERGMFTLLKTLRAKKPKGTTFTINAHWTDTDFGYATKPKLRSSNGKIRAAKYADQVIIEGGAIDPGLHYALPAKQPWSYRRLLNYADAMHKQRIKLQWEKTGSSDLTLNKSPLQGAPTLAKIPSCRDTDLQSGTWFNGDASWAAHVRSAAFNYATAMLTFVKGDNVGDMCEYPGRGWRGYEANLGLPVGKRFERGELVIRELTGGVVVVNPSDRPARYVLPSGRTGVDLASTVWPLNDTPVTAVTLAPRTAAVVDYQ
ncbi:MAG: hypothetical protein JHD16_07485 [Solirubrobacteraceae bacterium]|nr:hypothetical protein [Solirubrobacteraceae bacterium]